MMLSLHAHQIMLRSAMGIFYFPARALCDDEFVIEVLLPHCKYWFRGNAELLAPNLRKLFLPARQNAPQVLLLFGSRRRHDLLADVSGPLVSNPRTNFIIQIVHK